ncbi:MAG: M23 family metallopeptidase [Novosphingobium sp.]
MNDINSTLSRPNGSDRVRPRLRIATVALSGAALATVAAGTYATSLAQREAAVQTAESRLAIDRQGSEARAAELARRQDVIEKMVDAHLEALPSDGPAGVGGGGGPDVRPPTEISLATPGAPTLAGVEAQQLSLVARLTRFAERQSAAAAARIRRLGLSPRAMLGSSQDRAAQGGPLLPLATEADGTLDPRFRRLGESLAKMESLERGFAAIPQVLPAKLEFISSGFGYRSDPFTGSAAFHAGLDFRGPTGAPIYAAAPGRVSYAGVRQGYGNCVEIDHGHGLMTRYAHMSAFRAHLGEKVEGGAVIGAIGSTGRSTGPHLHFEVRINDRPVNPRPFLAAATHSG